MKKKLIMLVMIITMLFSVAVGYTASAAEGARGLGNCTVRPDDYDFTNKFIEMSNKNAKGCRFDVDKKEAKELSKNLKDVEKMVDKANKQILKLVREAQKSENPDIDELVEITNSIAFGVIEKAASMGVAVICEYEAFEIAGQTVYIDPLRIINR